MGETREASVLEAELGDALDRAVSTAYSRKCPEVAAKLTGSQIDGQEYRQALSMTESLLKELKQLDDKIILTEVYLLESRASHAIQNLPRAKVRLLLCTVTLVGP